MQKLLGLLVVVSNPSLVRFVVEMRPLSCSYISDFIHIDMGRILYFNFTGFWRQNCFYYSHIIHQFWLLVRSYINLYEFEFSSFG
eukprot:g5370.t1